MADFAWLGEPIDARKLFQPERAELLALLGGLDAADWSRTAVPGWSVRDVAAHLLGDDYGRLARDRDGHGGPRPRDGEDLAGFIHRINQEWVDACARLSPRCLIDTLTLTGDQIAALWQGSDPDGRSLGVSWAGADPAPLWLDCARDLTEYWVHRQQIREAVGLRPDLDERLLLPVLDTFLRALPFTLRDVAAVPGTRLDVNTLGRTWRVTATANGWSLAEASAGEPAAMVHVEADTLWRLCTRGIEPEDAIARSRIEGDQRLGRAACRIVSIIRD
ncbi:maleylpyruvate isomerase family mycothiol-dependent enzyme [Prauserella endophytica]|uniref:Maleylpyruvate isomerase family mycothiol-dependent enzyme n=1 Tax=Prauserella endophytica TaxID=1592324 RepID=A0ABY2RW43_9PSEU|nr:maleylpyruvate isomerase family mycothiol-dependent enzyme [Prauserella endophytica]TKG62888.1 maleylpyruvate isomerase family mycothiol-dependent enzyme [Prauserella endophytica]